jgi:hypothetical protein
MKSKWIEELAAIQSDIPDYAEWRIPDLIDAFLRYHDMLMSLTDLPEFRDGCTNLLRHSGFIQKCILETRGNNPWAPFTRAAYELHKDIEQLRIVLLDAHATETPLLEVV